MTSELIRRITLLKQNVDGVKRMPFTQTLKKAQVVEGIVQDAVFIIEDMALSHYKLQQAFNELKSQVSVNGE